MVELGRDAELVVDRVAEVADVETDESEKEENKDIINESEELVEIADII